MHLSYRETGAIRGNPAEIWQGHDYSTQKDPILSGNRTKTLLEWDKP